MNIASWVAARSNGLWALSGRVQNVPGPLPPLQRKHVAGNAGKKGCGAMPAAEGIERGFNFAGLHVRRDAVARGATQMVAENGATPHGEDITSKAAFGVVCHIFR